MSRYTRYCMLVIVLFGGILMSGVASAHEHRHVGPYEFTVGFINEPAFQGEQNGIWLNVVNEETGEPVEGLADTLTAEVIYGAAQREMELTPAWNEPGVYTAVFYPTAAGDYTFRFSGDIEGAQVDESFTSGPDGFDSVKAPAELQFPVRVASADELTTQLTAAQNTIRITMILAGAGLLLGLASLIMAAMALRSKRATTSDVGTSVASTSRS